MSFRRPTAAALRALPLLLALPAALRAQTPASAATAPPSAPSLSLATMMRGPELYGREPQRVRWTPDGRWIYFQWNAAGTDWREPLRPYRVRPAAGATPERVTEAHMDSVGPLLEEGSPSRDRRWRAVAWDGDLYLVDVRAARARRLTTTLAAETSPQFAADGRRVFFVRDDNVFAIDVDGGAVRQLTDVRRGPAPDSARAAGQRGALERDQRALFDVIRDRVARDSAAAAERRAREGGRPAPLWLNAGERVGQLSVSPDGRALLLTTVVPSTRARTAQVPDWVTRSGYVEELPTRTKVGDDQTSGRVAFSRSRRSPTRRRACAGCASSPPTRRAPRGRCSSSAGTTPARTRS